MEKDMYEEIKESRFKHECLNCGLKFYSKELKYRCPWCESWKLVVEDKQGKKYYIENAVIKEEKQ